MKKRIVSLFIMALLTSVLLVACGGDATVPTYTGGTSVTMPDALKTQFTSGIKDVKNAKVEAYKTGDDTNKVKSFFTDNFSKNGWDDKTSEMGADAAKSLDQLKGFVVGYQKDNKAAIIMGLPGSAASLIGFTGVTDKDTLYMVFTGEK